MRLIKRYPNRKLYDTDAKQYITLEGIADLIREGEEVRVTDNATGEDLTALTLTQIIFEQEKKQSGWFPRSVLAGLIQSSSERLNSLQRSLASPMEILHGIDEEIKRRVQVLVKEGDMSEGEGQTMIEKLLSQRFRPLDAQPLNEETIERILRERQVPTRDDLRQLQEQLERLDAHLSGAGPAGDPG